MRLGRSIVLQGAMIKREAALSTAGSFPRSILLQLCTELTSFKEDDLPGDLRGLACSLHEILYYLHKAVSP